jgi:high-affinity Fe2+/Pb2+ permease
VFDRDVELQKIQTLNEYFNAWFQVLSSLLIGGFIGLTVLLLTIYYDGIINLLALTVGSLIIYPMFLVFGLWFIRRQQDNFITLVDGLLKQVENCEGLPSLLELKKRIRP